mmetsp:Transcript_62064/g.145641  ORF Transcript_62064/g.145641 Transcript_62064/m.145641 type:complete len:266 (-) Transcript_62064:2795-3592(-)
MQYYGITWLKPGWSKLLLSSAETELLQDILEALRSLRHSLLNDFHHRPNLERVLLAMDLQVQAPASTIVSTASTDLVVLMLDVEGVAMMLLPKAVFRISSQIVTLNILVLVMIDALLVVPAGPEIDLHPCPALFLLLAFQLKIAGPTVVSIRAPRADALGVILPNDERMMPIDLWVANHPVLWQEAPVVGGCPTATNGNYVPRPLHDLAVDLQVHTPAFSPPPSAAMTPAPTTIRTPCTHMPVPLLNVEGITLVRVHAPVLPVAC